METSIQERDIYSVSRLNREVRTVLESGFPMIWLQAEISNLARPASGHWYFSLKDEYAQVRCAMFRNRNMHTQCRAEDGQLVLVRAKIGLYEARGEYQLIIEHMEAAGEGALRQQFEMLKQKLHAAGLFDSEHKKAFPEFPNRAGIITSASGAAIHDILTTLQRRYPVLEIIIYPVSVQGSNASREIIAAIEMADQQKLCDVLVLSRGGGSLEDLWSFNDEQLAHAIYNCSLPIVTGVGHDVDFTIADFVADHRAPTPTAAAEFITPDKYELLKHVSRYTQALAHTIRTNLRHLSQSVASLQGKLVHPGRRLQDNNQRLDELALRLQKSTLRHLQHQKQAVTSSNKRLGSCSPLLRINHAMQQLLQDRHRLTRAIQANLQTSENMLSRQSATLNAVSPLATLQRGYAIVSREADNKLVKACVELSPGNNVITRLADGTFTSKVMDIDVKKNT